MQVIIRDGVFGFKDVKVMEGNKLWEAGIHVDNWNWDKLSFGQIVALTKQELDPRFVDAHMDYSRVTEFDNRVICRQEFLVDHHPKPD